MSEYRPMRIYFSPASIPQIVAHIEDYLYRNPIVSTETIAEIIVQALSEHPELLNGSVIPITEDSEQSIKAYIDSLTVDTYTKAQIDTLLSGKQNTLQFDNTPTAESTNPVTSDGINTALVTLESAINAVLVTKANAANVYTKAQTDTILLEKADVSNVYSKNTIDAMFETVPTLDDVYDKSDIDYMRQIDKANTAIVTTDGIAPTNISAGQYVYVGDVLYMATQAISQGDAVVPGTNAELNPLGVTNRIGDGLQNVAGAVSSLSQQIANLSGINGKKILIIGDSISDESLYPNCWVKHFRTSIEKNGGSIVNYSLQGRTIGIYSGATNYLMNIVSGIPDNDYDEIIVFLGTNDWINQVPLGHIASSDVNSVGKNIHLFRTWVKTNYPNANVTFITPLKGHIENDLRHKLLQFYCLCISSSALWCGFNVIDAHSYAPMLSQLDIGEWLTDGIHPKDSYAPYLSRFIFDNFINKTNSLGLDSITTKLAISDVNGLSTTTAMHYTGNGMVFYTVSNFNVSETGNIKIADLPEECQTKNILYGIAQLSNYGTVYDVKLISTGIALYVYVPSGTPSGVISGTTQSGIVGFITQTGSSY